MSAALLLNTTLELKSLLRIILEQSARLCDAEASSLALLDEPSRDLIFAVSVGASSDLVEQIRIPYGKGIIGWVIDRGEEVRVDDCENDPRFYRDVDKATAFQTRNILAVPLVTKRGVIGGVEVLNKKCAGGFTDGDARILKALGAQAALAVENAKLYESMLGEKNRIVAIVNAIADGILVIDPSGEVALANPSARKIWDLDRPEIRAKLDVILAEILRAGDDRTFDLVLMKPENLILSNRVSNLFGGAGERVGYVVSSRNVTAAKSRENARIEFINILAVQLIDRMERWLETAKPDPGTRAAVEDFTRTVQKFTHFIDVVSGPLRLNRFSYRIGAIVETAVARMRPFLDAKPLAFDLAVEDFEIDTDDERLADCLFIILENAVRFTPAGGRVRMGVRRTETGAAIEVEDNGIGMTEADEARLRDKAGFLEQPSESGGTSLGLLYVQHVVEALSGRFRVTSAVGRGTTVTLDLPLAIV